MRVPSLVALAALALVAGCVHAGSSAGRDARSQAASDDAWFETQMVLQQQAAQQQVQQALLASDAAQAPIPPPPPPLAP